MNPQDILALIFQYDFAAGLSGLSARAEKDRLRVEAFISAAGSKMGEFASAALIAAAAGDTGQVAYNLNQANAFRLAAQRLAGEGVSALNGLRAYQFPKDFFRFIGDVARRRWDDPWHGWREKVREFAAAHGLDPRFRDLMG